MTQEAGKSKNDIAQKWADRFNNPDNRDHDVYDAILEGILEYAQSREQPWVRVETPPGKKIRESANILGVTIDKPFQIGIATPYLVHFDDGNTLLCMWDQVNLGSDEWQFRVAFDDGIRFGDAPEPRPTHYMKLPPAPPKQ